MALTKGSSGNAVKQIQSSLNALGAGLHVDGIWGEKTQSAYEQLGERLPSHIANIAQSAGSDGRSGGNTQIAGAALTSMQAANAYAQQMYRPAQVAREDSVRSGYDDAYQAVVEDALRRGQGGSYAKRSADYVVQQQASMLEQVQADAARQQDALALDALARARALQLELEKIDSDAKLDAQRLQMEQSTLDLEVQLMREQIAQQQAQASAAQAAAARRRSVLSTGRSSSGGSSAGGYGAGGASGYSYGLQSAQFSEMANKAAPNWTSGRPTLTQNSYISRTTGLPVFMGGGGR